MKQNTTTIRISAINKFILREFITENFREKNRSSNTITDDELITFLIRENTGFFYESLKAKAQNELNNRLKRKQP